MNRFLLDTNVVSEIMKPKPARPLVQWFGKQISSSLHISVVSLGELHRGIHLLPIGSEPRLRLEDWYSHVVLPTFESRILDVTQPVAEKWGELTAVAKLNQRTLPGPDSLIAATAIAHGLTMVTRNVRDFARTGVNIINPWEL